MPAKKRIVSQGAACGVTEQSVLITGATSGIGRATAELLTSQGYRVFGTGRHPTAARLDGFQLLPLDVTMNESVTACVAEVKRQTGGQLDVLINNVGTGILGAAEESSAEQVRQLFEINFFGAVRMTNAVLPMPASPAMTTTRPSVRDSSTAASRAARSSSRSSSSNGAEPNRFRRRRSGPIARRPPAAARGRAGQAHAPAPPSARSRGERGSSAGVRGPRR